MAAERIVMMISAAEKCRVREGGREGGKQGH
jgi:hypothetical protein